MIGLASVPHSKVDCYDASNVTMLSGVESAMQQESSLARPETSDAFTEARGGHRPDSGDPAAGARTRLTAPLYDKEVA